MKRERGPAPPRPTEPLGRALMRGLALVLALGLGLAPPALRAADAGDDIIVHRLRPGDNPWQVVKSRLRSLALLPQVLSLNGIDDPTQLPTGAPIKLRARWLIAAPLSSQVAHVAGAVVWRANERESFRPLAAGESLRAGAQIRTEADGQCTLALPGGSQTVVRPDSEVHVLQLQGQSATGLLQLRLKVLRGSIENLVDRQRPGGRFEIRTPAGVATVRGTGFRVATEGERTQMAVDEGRVRLGNAAGERLVPAGFRTIVAKGEAPAEPAALLGAPDLSALPKTLERFPAVLDLPAVDGMTAARGQWLLGADPASTVLEGIHPRLVLTGQGVPDGDHALRVRLIDAEGIEGQAATVPVKVHRRPDPPAYIQPAPSAVVSQAQPGLVWGKGAPPQVRVQISRSADMSELLLDKTLPNSGEWAVSEDLAPGPWHWRLASVDAQGEAGPWGPVQKFFRAPKAPAGSQGLEPSDDVLQARVLRWAPVPGAQGYELALRSLKDPQAPEITAEVGPEATWTLPRALEAGDYALRLRTVIEEGVRGDWSEAQTLTVPRNWLPWIWLPIVLPLLFL